MALVLWSLGVTLAFDKRAYEIDAFNARTRLAVTTGELDIRSFDAKGLPLSYSARTQKQYISPFYVVHYGLMYSNNLPGRDRKSGPEWVDDESMAYWNLPPKNFETSYFKNCADWIVSHVEYSHGEAHLIYDFDWKYHNYPNGGLTAPWWSGLTDGYAIILLLRAYDEYHDDRYLDIAGQLYKSVLTPIAEGGSLNMKDGQPWIEEYVDPRAKPEKMSFVLNGMIYATYGIDAYEKYMDTQTPEATKLYDSISKNVGLFDQGYWSDYDAIGNAANIKYHRVHVALLADIAKKTGDSRLWEIRERWAFGMNNAGLYWIAHSRVGLSQLQFLLEYLFSLMGPWLFTYVMLRRKAARISRVEAQ